MFPVYTGEKVALVGHYTDAQAGEEAVHVLRLGFAASLGFGLTLPASG